MKQPLPGQFLLMGYRAGNPRYTGFYKMPKERFIEKSYYSALFTSSTNRRNADLPASVFL